MTKLKESPVYTAELLLFFLFPLSLLVLDVHKKFLFPNFALVLFESNLQHTNSQSLQENGQQASTVL